MNKMKWEFIHKFDNIIHYLTYHLSLKREANHETLVIYFEVFFILLKKIAPLQLHLVGKM